MSQLQIDLESNIPTPLLNAQLDPLITAEEISAALLKLGHNKVIRIDMLSDKHLRDMQATPNFLENWLRNLKFL